MKYSSVKDEHAIYLEPPVRKSSGLQVEWLGEYRKSFSNIDGN